jgi:hypothetical protein
VDDQELLMVRMNRLDREEAEANRLGIDHRFMHMSALSPTTRRSHAERSGNLYTADEIREWVSEGENSVGCKCAFVQVLVDENGKLRAPNIAERLRVARDKYLANLGD